MVNEARMKPFTVQSDYARGRALGVALAASLGYITTLQTKDTFGKRWMVTKKGSEFIHRGWFV